MRSGSQGGDLDMDKREKKISTRKSGYGSVCH